jgi:hypothetical protein
MAVLKTRKLYASPNLLYWSIFLNLILLFTKLIDIGDYAAHLRILLTFLEHNRFPAPPGYPALVWLFSLGTKEALLIKASILVMGCMVFFKIWVIKKVLDRFVGSVSNEFVQLNFFLALLISISAPVWNGGEYFYIGRLAWNVWHNPTYITVLPFSILLFMFTPSFIKKPLSYAPLISFLVLLNLLIKPSFLFAWIPAVFFYTLLKEKKINLKVFQVSFILFASGIAILTMFMIIYLRGGLDELVLKSEASGIGLAFFIVWKSFIDVGDVSLLGALITSFLFPLLFFLFYGRSRRINTLTRLSLVQLLFGVIFALIIVETGERLMHGNFFWTAYATVMMLYIAVIVNVLQIYRVEKLSPRMIILAGVFLLHAFTGGFYIYQIIETLNYL